MTHDSLLNTDIHIDLQNILTLPSHESSLTSQASLDPRLRSFIEQRIGSHGLRSLPANMSMLDSQFAYFRNSRLTEKKDQNLTLGATIPKESKPQSGDAIRLSSNVTVLIDGVTTASTPATLLDHWRKTDSKQIKGTTDAYWAKTLTTKIITDESYPDAETLRSTLRHKILALANRSIRSNPDIALDLQTESSCPRATGAAMDRNHRQIHYWGDINLTGIRHDGTIVNLIPENDATLRLLYTIDQLYGSLSHGMPNSPETKLLLQQYLEQTYTTKVGKDPKSGKIKSIAVLPFTANPEVFDQLFPAELIHSLTIPRDMEAIIMHSDGFADLPEHAAFFSLLALFSALKSPNGTTDVARVIQKKISPTNIDFDFSIPMAISRITGAAAPWRGERQRGVSDDDASFILSFPNSHYWSKSSELTSGLPSYPPTLHTTLKSALHKSQIATLRTMEDRALIPPATVYDSRKIQTVYRMLTEALRSISLEHSGVIVSQIPGIAQTAILDTALERVAKFLE